MKRNVLHCTEAVVCCLPAHISEVLVFGESGAHDGVGVKHAYDRCVIVADVGDFTDDAVCAYHAHIFFDAVFSSFVDEQEVVKMINTVVDNVSRYESIIRTD